MKIVIAIAAYFYVLTCAGQLKPIKAGVYKWGNHPVKEGQLKTSTRILKGMSTHLEYLEIYTITLMPGALPDKGYANINLETCIIIKEGLMQVTLENEPSVLVTGGVFLLMPNQIHSIKNIGDTNLTYYVMQYRSKKKMNMERAKSSGGSMLLNPQNLVSRSNSRGGSRSYFNRPTAMCERFEMHVTRLNKKGSRHPPHRHIESEIILVITGNTEQMIDKKTYKGTAGDIYFMPSQSFHSISNTKDSPCTYFAFKWN